MQLKRMMDENDPSFQEAWQIYESSFPPAERRDLELQKKIFKRAEFRFFAIVSDAPDNRVVGVLSIWNLPGFVFGEHFAFKPELRGQGHGTKLMNESLKNLKKQLVLEVEPPEIGEMAKKRILFYERLGLVLNPHRYTQPPYGTQKPPVRLLLMTYPNRISDAEFVKIRSVLYTKVYGLAKPIEG